MQAYAERVSRAITCDLDEDVIDVIRGRMVTNQLFHVITTNSLYLIPYSLFTQNELPLYRYPSQTNEHLRPLSMVVAMLKSQTVP